MILYSYQYSCRNLYKLCRLRHHHYKAKDSIWADEQQRFDRLATNWWDPNGPLSLLHQMNTARITYLHQQININKISRSKSIKTMTETTIGSSKPISFRDNINSVFIEKWLTGWRVLDIGCGGGILSESLARLGAEVVGIDISNKAIQEAQQHQRLDPSIATNPIYRVTTAEELLHEGEKFDLVMAMEVLEHTHQPDVFFETLCNLLVPEGLLVISTIERTMLSFVLTIFIAEYLLRLVPRQTHIWRRFIRRADIKDWVSRCPDISFVDCRGVIYLPWRRTWKIMSPSALWAQQCNYFVTIQKEKIQKTSLS
ncbi:hypothetical protein PORY_002785 [Pneumocystis oryctolagi]|uniref:Uncharacterized protein n=1 Tax=Pneumocystis oryctolagi TaxID=42067 RepID=A0ACB7CBG8_9ASCO|nr:hypothetical protein PORY_002785 [Pneumocystis oryctolagi]